MKIGILTPGYPTDRSSGFAFVHARAKLYLEGNELLVFNISKKPQKRIFEDVNIVDGSASELIRSINDFHPDILCVHYPDLSILKIATKLYHFPQIAWIHGHEIIWSTRITKTRSISAGIKKRLLLLPRLLIQTVFQRSYLKRISKVVFVSRWMKNEAEKHSRLSFKNYEIIPNPIDTNLFNYNEPSEEKMHKAVSLRSLTNNKYGLDIAIQAFQNETICTLDIYGHGQLYTKYLKLVEKLKSNTKIHHTSINHNKIPQLYSNYGFFVAPSRVEAQGVAMCEAMACGLPIISTNVGGIPEYVRNGVDGYLVEKENPKALKDAIDILLTDFTIYKKMSLNAREYVQKVCSGDVVLRKEIALMEEVIRLSQKTK